MYLYKRDINRLSSLMRDVVGDYMFFYFVLFVMQYIIKNFFLNNKKIWTWTMITCLRYTLWFFYLYIYYLLKDIFFFECLVKISRVLISNNTLGLIQKDFDVYFIFIYIGLISPHTRISRKKKNELHESYDFMT